MIRRVSTITSVGIFKAFRAPKELPDLGQRTVFFGSNGHGKSTLVSILRSLAIAETDGLDILKGKRTLGATSPTNVVIDWHDGEKSLFQGEKWVKKLPADTSVHIFDAEYVRDNLFTDMVTIEHRRAICGIVLGAPGQLLATRLNDALEKKKEHAKQIKRLRLELDERQARVGSSHNYLEIPEKCSLENVTARLRRLEKEIEHKTGEEALRKRKKVPQIVVGQVPVTDWREVANRSVSSTHEAAQALVQAHLQKHFGGAASGQNFAYSGIRVAKETCPFCDQDLASASGLMSAYRSAFDGKYAEAKQALERLLANVQSFRPASFMSEPAQGHEAALQCAEEWKSLLVNPPTISTLPTWWRDVREELEQVYAELVRHITTKKDAIDHHVPPQLFDKVNGVVARVGQWHRQVNEEIAGFNAAIDEYLRSLGETTLAALRQKRGIALAYEQRFSALEVKWAEDYRMEADRERVIDTALKDADMELRNYSASVFDKYQRAINRTLSSIGCGFSLKELKPAELKGGIKSVPATLVLEIESHEVSTETQDRKKPNFRNTLSEGDKNCLALAFFLAGLELDSDLGKAVVVFDDPFTSLDRDRRLKLHEEICRHAGKAKQAIIFTHNSDFLKLVASGGLFSSDKGVPYIHVFAHGSAGATLKPLVLEEYLRDEHSRRVERLVEWEETGVFPSTSEVFKDLRRSIEFVIDVKWGHRLGAAQNLGDQYRTLKSKQLLSSETLEEINSLHTATSSQLHDNQTYRVLRDASHGETCAVLRQGLKLLEKV
ncbi:MAG: AAA family ATPase [Candidatus Sumerlaeia bacterium]|nr:AAA family ATPase [Candidatus Sumerlaeia bacterium]